MGRPGGIVLGLLLALVGAVAGCAREVFEPRGLEKASLRSGDRHLACPNQNWENCWATLRAPTASQDEKIWNEIMQISTHSSECQNLRNAALDTYFDFSISFYDASAAPPTLAGDIHLDLLAVHISDIGDATNGYPDFTFSHEAAHTIGYGDGPYNNAAQLVGRCLG